MLGLPKGQVFLVDWDKEWEVLFDIEKRKIFDLIKGENIKVHHIGSTSVKNLKAKPILDIAIEIDSFKDVHKYIDLLTKLNYQSIGNDILPDRYYFIKGNPRTHQIHLFEKDNHFLIQQIKFRNILRTHPAVKNEYEELKLKLAHSHCKDKHKYADMKTDFIMNVLKE